MALRYTVGFARRDPIGLVTLKRTLGPGARTQCFPAEAGSVLRRHRFGADMPFRLGVEEELLLADRPLVTGQRVGERQPQPRRERRLMQNTTGATLPGPMPPPNSRT